jgi:hypothetical protein
MGSMNGVPIAGRVARVSSEQEFIEMNHKLPPAHSPYIYAIWFD